MSKDIRTGDEVLVPNGCILKVTSVFTDRVGNVKLFVDDGGRTIECWPDEVQRIKWTGEFDFVVVD